MKTHSEKWAEKDRVKVQSINLLKEIPRNKCFSICMTKSPQQITKHTCSQI